MSTNESKGTVLPLQGSLDKREIERQVDALQYEPSRMGAILSPLMRELHPSIGVPFALGQEISGLGAYEK